MKKQVIEEIYIKDAMQRLHLTRKGVLYLIDHGMLNARLVTDTPRPYYRIAVDSLFLAEEKARSQSGN